MRLAPHTILGGIALSALLPTQASAFCGHYVGHAGAELYNHTSQVAIARQGNRTTLTLANDIEGDVKDFALVIPVPQILGAGDIRVVEPELFTSIDAYSAPRLVEYTCDDFKDYDLDAAANEDGDGSGGERAEGGVTIEAEYAVGEYEIVILSATESGGLIAWLDANGYAVGSEAAGLLGEYIDAGAYFFAAKVKLQHAPIEGATLSPLQFSYTADMFGLPIRIGTLSSPGEQDLIAYVVTEANAGQVGISNYPQAELEDECLWIAEEWEDDFGAFYADKFAQAIEGAGGPAWVQEYSWTPAWCDPCIGDPLTDEQVQSMGFDGAATDAHFTRLHMRYGKDITEDVVFYTSGINATEQVRYIRWIPEVEEHYPVCDVGQVENPGTCDNHTSGLDDPPYRRSEAATGCGCTVGSSGAAGLVAFLPLLALWRRRRS